MDEKEALKIIEQLRDGSVDSHLINKDEFMVFRNVLISQLDRSKFIGIAQKGGQVIYQYENE